MEGMAVSLQIFVGPDPVQYIQRDEIRRPVRRCFGAEKRANPRMPPKGGGSGIVIGDLALYPHGVRSGEHEVETGAHCRHRASATLGRKLRMDRINARPGAGEYKAAMLRAQRIV